MLIGQKAWGRSDINKAIRTANALRNISFDPAYFNVTRTGSGINISLSQRNTSSNEASDFHLQANLSSIDVSGGVISRWIGGYQYSCPMFDMDDNDSPNYESNVYTLSLTGQTEGFVYLKLIDDAKDETPVKPTHCIPAFYAGNTYPEGTTFDPLGTRMIIGYVEINGTSDVITNIIQLDRDDDTHYFVDLDGSQAITSPTSQSLEYDPKTDEKGYNYGQIKGWSNATNNVLEYANLNGSELGFLQKSVGGIKQPVYTDIEAISVITDIRWNNTSHTIDVKTRNVYVIAAADESDWTTKITTVPCP